MKLRVVVVVLTLTFLGLSAAWAQEAVDVPTLGERMAYALEEGEYDVAYESAELLIEAQPEDLTQLEPEEQYWIGRAHLVMTARLFDMCCDQLPQEHHASFAAWVRNWILHPHVRTIARGEEVDIEDYLVEGQTVVFEFFSPYGGLGTQVGQAAQVLASERDDVVLIRVNINRPDVERIDLDSPVAQQYDVNIVPHYMVYGPDGELQAEGREAQMLIADLWRETAGQ